MNMNVRSKPRKYRPFLEQLELRHCPSTASLVTTDTATQGSWVGVYGGDGYRIVGDSTSYPSYATVSVSGGTCYTWASSTSDVRALQKGSNDNSRIAAALYNNSSFTLNVNLIDGNTHQVGLYLLDWDSTDRAETIDVKDYSTDAVLDSESASDFNGGEYLVWDVSGHVNIDVTDTTGSNAVVSGLFCDPTSSNGDPPVVTAPATLSATQGVSQNFALGSFTDSGAGDSPWSVVVHWGDSTANTQFDQSTAGNLSATHTYANTGTFTEIVTVTNSANLSGSGSTAITVSPPTTGSWTHIQDNPGSGTGWSGGLNHRRSPLATGPFPSQVTVGDYVFVFVSIFNQSDNSIPRFSCTDNAATPNTYALVLDYMQGEQTSGVLIFGTTIGSLPSSGNLNCTVTWSNVSGPMGAQVCASEFSGGSLNTDGINGTSEGESDIAATTGPITTTVNNDLILTIEENDNTGAGSTMSTPSGFTTIGLNRPYIISGAAYEIVSGIYSGDLTWDTAPHDSWSTGQVALRPSAASPRASLTATQGVSTLFGLGSFTDSGTSDTSWSVVVNWGDSTSNTSFTLNAPGNLTVSHTYANTGTFTDTVSVTNNNGLSGSGSTFIAVSSSPPPGGYITTLYDSIPDFGMGWLIE
jgi:hypothetical protein